MKEKVLNFISGLSMIYAIINLISFGYISSRVYYYFYPYDSMSVFTDNIWGFIFIPSIIGIMLSFLCSELNNKD